MVRNAYWALVSLCIVHAVAVVQIAAVASLSTHAYTLEQGTQDTARVSSMLLYNNALI